jgi:glycosyltransferase involved in cell wall biosynthesis
MDSADIVLSWSYFPESKATYSIFCSHGCDHHTERLVRENRNIKDYHFTAVSNVAAAPWVKYGPSKIIYNGCDTERLKPKISREAMRRKYKIYSNEILIGFISRLIPEKNPWVVAIAAHELRNQGVKARALFVGAGKDVPQYKDCIYLPRTEEIGNVLGALDCFMLPSNSEAFSLAITEAWLAGVPVVATPVGAIKELENIYGPMVVRLDTSPTTAVLEAVSEGNKSVVNNAFKIAHEHFTTKAMIARWEEYFNELART